MAPNYSEILKKLNVAPDKYDLYNQAVTTPAFANENKRGFDYNRLEFLGDAVISLLTAEYLFKHQSFDEHQMTEAKKAMVQSATLARACREVSLDQAIRLGKGEPVEIAQKLAEDVFEAFCGALYLEQGIEKVRLLLDMTIIKYYREEGSKLAEDYKTAMQERIQQRGWKYEYKNGEPSPAAFFNVTVVINGQEAGKGGGKNLKEAQQKAAKATLEGFDAFTNGLK